MNLKHDDNRGDRVEWDGISLNRKHPLNPRFDPRFDPRLDAELF
jgi:hypothetical protein